MEVRGLSLARRDRVDVDIKDARPVRGLPNVVKAGFFLQFAHGGREEIVIVLLHVTSRL